MALHNAHRNFSFESLSVELTYDLPIFSVGVDVADVYISRSVIIWTVNSHLLL